MVYIISMCKINEHGLFQNIAQLHIFWKKKVYVLSNDPIFMKLCALERGDLGASNDGTAIFFGPSEVTITSFEVKKLLFF